jgi:integrase
MTELGIAIEDYVALRRRLGTTLHEAARILRSFAAFAEREGAAHLTIDLALRWATHVTGISPATMNTRIQMVRRFALWRHVSDPLTEVPPADLLPARYRRKPPSLFQEEDIARLLDAARQLPSSTGLRGMTYYTLFGLLVVTGLRISEALALDDADVQRSEALLTIRRSKFGKSRLIPLHASTIEQLAVYARTRDRVVPRRASSAVFLSEQGTRVTIWAAEYTFAKVSGQIGLRPPMHGHRHGHGPRLHDLRQHAGFRIMPDPRVA